MLKIKDGFVMRNICDEWIIVPIGERCNSETYIMSVNESGYLLWHMLEKGAKESELVQRVLEEYDITADVAQQDVQSFIAELKERNIV